MKNYNMNIQQKSIATLIDELITTSQKLFHLQETVVSSKDDKVVAEAARNVQKLNARRNSLIRAIDEYHGQESITQTGKTYA